VIDPLDPNAPNSQIDPEIQRPAASPGAPGDPRAVARAIAASTPHEPTGDTLNLARRPFLNSRPVTRTALLLWALGAILLAVNISFFWNYLSGSEDKRALIAKGDAEIDHREDAVRQLEARLNSYDLNANNEKVDFLNTRIAQRTFSWSLLLERLADVLPNDVRLSRLQPETGSEKRASSARTRVPKAGAATGEVPLTISGESKTNEALLRFQTNLFAHPAFGYPNLLSQAQNDNQRNVISFELTAKYIAGGTKPTGAAAAVSAAPVPKIGAGPATGISVPPGSSPDTLSIRKTPPPPSSGGGR
jgi:Tfp pilus assembly protein PilN